MQINDNAALGALDAIGVEWGASPYLQLYGGGDMPGLTATARAGTKYAEGQLPATPFAAAVASGGNRTKSKNGTWSVTGLTAAATGSDVRYYTAQDSAKTKVVAQGWVSMPWAQGATSRVGQQVHNANGVYQYTGAGTTSATGTGPTGTGSGITDGSATCKYMGPTDMTIDNTLIANAQVANVGSFALAQAATG